MNRDPGVRNRTERKFEPEYDRERKEPERYNNRIMSEPYPPRTERGPAPDSEYRTLCISNLNPRAPDHIVSQTLYEEFAKFGDFNVKVVHQGDHRIAYVNFKFAEDAREAKHSRRPGALVLFDMPVRVDSVIHQRRAVPNNYRESFRGGASAQGGGRGGRPAREEGEFFEEGSQYSENYRVNEHREHKFPHHLHHIAPEDDEMSTRTLFVGNLDNNITDEELRSVFSKFGIVEEIDIKYPAKQGYVGNAYAFVKFINLDMAHRAKVEMSGKYIGKFQCKIGYGKVSATNCLWVGGLGPWVTMEILEQEFDRFGAIQHIEWRDGKNYGYVLYDNADAAQAACSEMRGFPIGGKEHRMRVDFADDSHIGQDFNTQLPPPPSVEVARPPADFTENRSEPWRGNEPVHNESWNANERNDHFEFNNGDGRGKRTSFSSDRGHANAAGDNGRNNGRASSFSPATKRKRSLPASEHRAGNHEQRGVMELGDVSHVDSISELSKCLPVVWNGALVLKNSAFAARMHLLSGDVHLVDTLMRDPTSTEMSMLKITQRLRLDPPKLDEVGRRVSAAGKTGHAVLLAMPGSSEALEDASLENSVLQQRPLKNLVSYLKQKDAAGVITLPPNPSKDRDNIGVLHAFPSCPFSTDFLTKRAPKLKCGDGGREEHLVIVVVIGAALA